MRYAIGTFGIYTGETKKGLFDKGYGCSNQFRHRLILEAIVTKNTGKE